MTTSTVLIREAATTAAIPPMCPVCYRKPCECGSMADRPAAPIDLAPVCANCGQVYISCTCPKWLGVTDWDAELSALCPRCQHPAGSCICKRIA